MDATENDMQSLELNIYWIIVTRWVQWNLNYYLNI